MARAEAVAEYGRDDIRRLLQVSERRLRAWEKQGLVNASGPYGFSEIAALRTIKSLSDQHFSSTQIRRAVSALQRYDNIERPFEQARFSAEGRRIAVHLEGDKLDPVSGQMLFDFDARGLSPVRAFPMRRRDPEMLDAGARAAEAEAWFQRGLALEETGAPVEEAAAAYRKAVDVNPRASGALVNLGTIAFRMHKLKEAESYYRRAIESDPSYGLAHFNIGNLFDEQGSREQARTHYLEAIRLTPRYADAYFNLALLCERNNEILQAIGYWQNYLKLDSTSSWANAARKQLDRLKRQVRSK